MHQHEAEGSYICEQTTDKIKCCETIVYLTIKKIV